MNTVDILSGLIKSHAKYILNSGRVKSVRWLTSASGSPTHLSLLLESRAISTNWPFKTSSTSFLHAMFDEDLWADEVIYHMLNTSVRGSCLQDKSLYDCDMDGYCGQWPSLLDQNFT
jgi:hypothetical protein